MDLKLKDKVALVSGSTAGIGLAIATSLAREGCVTWVNGRTQARVTEAVAAVKKAVPGAKVEGFAADLGTKAGCDALVKKLPAVDVLVNNLGIFEAKPFGEIPDEDWVRFFEVNVLSGVRLSRAYVPGMKSKNWGRVIFVSSESGQSIPAEMIHYGMTKTAQVAVARGLAETLTGTGVTVNTVLPGPTASEGVGGFVEGLAKAQKKTKEQVETEFFQTMRPSSIIKRFASTDEVASLVTYVASPLASATTGAALRCDGGLVRSIF